MTEEYHFSGLSWLLTGDVQANEGDHQAAGDPWGVSRHQFRRPGFRPSCRAFGRQVGDIAQASGGVAGGAVPAFLALGWLSARQGRAVCQAQ
eukprot:scaffold238233_cov48-Prasinocladus_malaysianus.AAC.1